MKLYFFEIEIWCASLGIAQELNVNYARQIMPIVFNIMQDYFNGTIRCL